MGFWLWVYNEPKNRNFSFYQFEKAALMNLTMATFSSRYTTVFPDTAIPFNVCAMAQWGKKLEPDFSADIKHLTSTYTV